MLKQEEAHRLLSGYLVFRGEAEGSMLFLLALGPAEIFFFFLPDENLTERGWVQAVSAECAHFLEPSAGRFLGNPEELLHEEPEEQHPSLRAGPWASTGMLRAPLRPAPPIAL